MNFDMVVPVPNTGKTYAKGFADKTGINYIELLNKIEDMRTCYMKDLDVRKSLIEKLINITDNDISGRSICLIDEAIFTGTTLKSVCDTLRRKQVGKITLMIPTPPCVGNCRYHELSSENMLLKNHSIEEACLYLGADRLRYQCKNDFESIISGTGITCKECFANKKNTERNTEYKINAHQA